MSLESVSNQAGPEQPVASDVASDVMLLLIPNSPTSPDDSGVEADAPQVGDIIEVEIADVRHYGFMVTTANGYKGLVHISEIAEEFIEFPEDYARPGDKHLAKVIVIEDKGLAMSFKALGGLKPVYQSNELPKAHQKADKLNEIAVKSAVAQLQAEGKKLISLVAKALGGKLTVRTEHEFLRLIKEYGIVDVTLKLQETLRDLDDGVLIAKIIEQKLNGSYEEYIPSNHSMDAYLERVSQGITRAEAAQCIIDKCTEGKILFDNGSIRIIQHGELAFPCVSDLKGWVIKTTLFYRMIANKTLDQLTREYY